MKKILTVIFIVSSFISVGQIKQDAKVIDLSLSYFDSENAVSSTSFFIQPLIGFGTSENEVIYGGLRYESTKIDFSTEEKRQLTSIILGYEKFFELNSSIFFAPFLSGSYGIGKVENVGGDVDLNRFSIGLRPRLHYFINSKWSVVASVGSIEYSREVVKSDGDDFTQNFFGASLNVSNVFFGIRLNLNNE